MGIIDVLEEYGLLKRMENKFKHYFMCLDKVSRLRYFKRPFLLCFFKACWTRNVVVAKIVRVLQEGISVQPPSLYAERFVNRVAYEIIEVFILRTVCYLLTVFGHQVRQPERSKSVSVARARVAPEVCLVVDS